LCLYLVEPPWQGRDKLAEIGKFVYDFDNYVGDKLRKWRVGTLLVVQKYGGTSLGNVERIEAVANRIANTCAAGHTCAVVVSAMGHTTDALVNLAQAIDRCPNVREMDALLATGEQVSAALLAIALQKRNIDAQSFTGWQAGIETESIHGAARMTKINPAVLLVALASGVVPVITGFQGIADGAVTTLGRGGSDTTAVAVAASLGADVCEIYTDVRGVYTTDPRLVTDARKLAEITYDEMLELATLGAQVLHPRAVETAKQFGVRLVVRSSFHEEEGTAVVESLTAVEQSRVVTGIACERDVARIALLGMPVANGGLAQVFSTLANMGMNVDVIVQSVVRQDTVDISFTLAEEDVIAALDILGTLREKLGMTDIVAERGQGKVSIVGAGMISNPGVAAKMFQCLADANIAIKMVSTSEIKVSCVVEADDVDCAVKHLHVGFELA